MDPLSMVIGGAIGWAIKPNGDIVPIPIGEKLKALKPQFSIPIAIDCSVAHTDEPFNHEGEFIFVRNPTGVSVAVNIKLNETDTPSFPLTELKQVTAPFYRFFITNDAGLGTLNLIVGRGYNFRLAEDIKQGIYLQPEWAARVGEDKTFSAYKNNVVSGDSILGDYVVTSSKTLYICGTSFRSYANLAADKDLNQMLQFVIADSTADVPRIEGGANGGGSLILTKPMVIPGGNTFRVYVANQANHNCWIWISAWGYEI